MTTFRLAAPWWLLALPLVAWLALRLRQRRAPALRHGGAAQLAPARGGLRTRAAGLLPWLRLGALALLLLALARPQTGSSRHSVTGDGVDLALALDISGSMAALDFQPDNRLEAARRVIEAFIKARPFDRLGLVVFASDAFKQAPLTVDHGVLQRQLEQVRLASELNLQDGTAIGQGLAAAADLLAHSKAKGRAIILLTDGVNNAGDIDPLTAAEAARALGIRVYTIGAGKPGRVPFPVPGFFGNDVQYIESELDEQLLSDVAQRTGGRYFRAQDADSLARIYGEIDRLEKSRYQVTQVDRYTERFGWALLPGLSLLGLSWVLGAGWLRSLP